MEILAHLSNLLKRIKIWVNKCIHPPYFRSTLPFHKLLKRGSNTQEAAGKNWFFPVRRFYIASNFPGILKRIRFPINPTGSIRDTVSFCIRHRILLIASISTLVFVIIFINGLYIAYVEFPRQLKQQNTQSDVTSTIPTDTPMTPTPTVAPPIDTPVPSEPDNLGATDNSTPECRR
jgi:hypothetical protein